MPKKKILIAAFTIMLISSCTNPSNPNGADAIYYGGDIITMEGDNANYAEAIALKEGKIVFVGSKSEAEKLQGDSTQMHDLQGKTLVPGFIDGHAHFAGFGAQAVAANLLANPDGSVNSMDDLINELKKWHKENGTSKTGGWIIGTGFDDAVLKEKGSPPKKT